MTIYSYILTAISLFMFRLLLIVYQKYKYDGRFAFYDGDSIPIRDNNYHKPSWYDMMEEYLNLDQLLEMMFISLLIAPYTALLLYKILAIMFWFTYYAFSFIGKPIVYIINRV